MSRRSGRRSKSRRADHCPRPDEPVRVARKVGDGLLVDALSFAQVPTEKYCRKAVPLGTSSIRQATGTNYRDPNPRAKIHGHFVIGCNPSPSKLIIIKQCFIYKRNEFGLIRLSLKAAWRSNVEKNILKGSSRMVDQLEKQLDGNGPIAEAPALATGILPNAGSALRHCFIRAFVGSKGTCGRICARRRRPRISTSSPSRAVLSRR